jgi:hypothetical protein
LKQLFNDLELDKKPKGLYSKECEANLQKLDEFLEKLKSKFYFGNLVCFVVFHEKYLFSFGDNSCGQLGLNFS